MAADDDADDVGLIATNFVLYWDLSLIVAWLPSYFTKGMGFTPANAAWLVSLIWMTSGICSPLVGFSSQKLLKRGIPSRWARGLYGSLSTALGGILIAVMAIQPVGLAKTALLLVGYVLSQNTAPLNFAMLSEITPSKRRGAVITMYTALIDDGRIHRAGRHGLFPASRGDAGRWFPRGFCDRRYRHPDRRFARRMADQPEGRSRTAGEVGGRAGARRREGAGLIRRPAILQATTATRRGRWPTF